jgi:hypothetical protein
MSLEGLHPEEIAYIQRSFEEMDFGEMRGRFISVLPRPILSDSVIAIFETVQGMKRVYQEETEGIPHLIVANMVYDVCARILEQLCPMTCDDMYPYCAFIRDIRGAILPHITDTILDNPIAGEKGRAFLNRLDTLFDAEMRPMRSYRSPHILATRFLDIMFDMLRRFLTEHGVKRGFYDQVCSNTKQRMMDAFEECTENPDSRNELFRRFRL